MKFILNNAEGALNPLFFFPERWFGYMGWHRIDKGLWQGSCIIQGEMGALWCVQYMNLNSFGLFLMLISQLLLCIPECSEGRRYTTILQESPARKETEEQQKESKQEKNQCTAR